MGYPLDPLPGIVLKNPFHHQGVKNDFLAARNIIQVSFGVRLDPSEGDLNSARKIGYPGALLRPDVPCTGHFFLFPQFSTDESVPRRLANDVVGSGESSGECKS